MVSVSPGNVAGRFGWSWVPMCVVAVTPVAQSNSNSTCLKYGDLNANVLVRTDVPPPENRTTALRWLESKVAVVVISTIV